MPCTIVVGGFFGDEGKGKIVSYLALKNRLDMVARTGSVNAGHTIVFEGRTYGLRMIPSAFVYDKCRLYVAPGANISPRIFFEELPLTGTAGRAWVDFQASIIDQGHIERDRATGGRIGTTGQGVGPAQEDRVKRIGRLARDVPELALYLADVPKEVNLSLNRGERVLLEGTQGTFLSLIHGTYPFVTSRDTTASAISSECGVGPRKVNEVLLVFKAYTTRVGRGPLEGELSREEALSRGWLETATVTGRERRAAPFNFQLAERAVMLNCPTQLALTKLDVLFPECWGIRQFDGLSNRAKAFIEEVQGRLGVPVTIIGTGPGAGEIVDRRSGT